MAFIVVVDDDPDVVDLVVMILKPMHEVVGLTQPNEALSLIRERSVDLLITDVRMPDQNGFTLIERAKGWKPALAVVVMSTYYDDKDEASRRIVKEYAPVALPKPLSRVMVTHAVNTALAL